MSLNLNKIANFFNGTALSQLAQNFDRIANEFPQILYRDGSNTMRGNLDMDGRRIINHGIPKDDNDLATIAQVREFSANITQGPPGTADNTYTSYALLLASPGSRRSARLVGDPNVPDGLFSYVNGQWIRQQADSVAFVAAGSPITRSTQDKIREFVSVKDYGAKGAPFDDTAAIQAALNSGITQIYFPPGEYLHTNLTISTPYQRLFGAGAKLTRTSATATIKIMARGVHFNELRIGCQTSGMGGNNVTVTSPDFRAIFCESRDCAGRAYLFLNCGGGIVINGGVVQTTGTGPDDYDVEIRDDAGGDNTLYCFASNVITNQHTGGWLFRGEVGSCAMDKCEFGKLTVDTGGGVKVDLCRIGGATNIQSGFVSLQSSDFNDDITVGTDGQPNIGSVRFGAGNILKAGKTISIASNVIESSFHLGQVANAGGIVNIRGWNNDIWCPAVDIPVVLKSQTGSPSFGDGTLIARMSSEGRRRFVTIDFQLGSTTSMGGGVFFSFGLPFKAKNSSTATAQITDAGTGFYTMAARILAGSTDVLFFPSSSGATATTSQANATFPFTWGNGDRIVFEISAEYSG